ncbi:hypothetical protein [Thiothrix sp.]|jgi:hypothetical protein|uniref:hypothetical protein n=1 Tax=Thiothrix sp. TaxID=1032 RepID=UPI00257F25BD|nr:hypothetical protein [Thiothrix sp.]
MSFKPFGVSLWVVLWSVLLSGCIFSSESQQVRETTEKFWQSVLAKDMETTKTLVTWESAQFLGFLSDNSVSAQRFETGEIKVQENIAEVATVLYGGEKGDMIIPVRTVLVRHQEVWLVDVQKTMGSMVSGAMGAVVEQLNTFMQNGLKDLDRALSDNVNQLNQNLKQGMDQLQKDLTAPPSAAPPAQAPTPPSNAI